MATCMLTPYLLAFQSNENMAMKIADGIINFLFLIDIIVNFNSSFYD
jgi:hypothetical protein